MAAAAVSVGWLDQRNASPVVHIWCMMTTSLRATAMRALFMPERLATRRPHALSADHFLPFSGGRLRQDSVSVPLSGSSAGWVHSVPLPGHQAGRALARPE